jgi:hypothetical protein
LTSCPRWPSHGFPRITGWCPCAPAAGEDCRGNPMVTPWFATSSNSMVVSSNFPLKASALFTERRLSGQAMGDAVGEQREPWGMQSVNSGLPFAENRHLIQLDGGLLKLPIDSFGCVHGEDAGVVRVSHGEPWKPSPLRSPDPIPH